MKREKDITPFLYLIDKKYPSVRIVEGARNHGKMLEMELEERMGDWENVKPDLVDFKREIIGKWVN